MTTGMPVESPVRGDVHAGLYVTRPPMLTTRSVAEVFPAKSDIVVGLRST
jgi:hypothetical protein